jgi:hypothetical protein
MRMGGRRAIALPRSDSGSGVKTPCRQREVAGLGDLSLTDTRIRSHSGTVAVRIGSLCLCGGAFKSWTPRSSATFAPIRQNDTTWAFETATARAVRNSLTRDDENDEPPEGVESADDSALELSQAEIPKLLADGCGHVDDPPLGAKERWFEVA